MIIPRDTFLWITTCSRQAQSGLIVSGGINDADFQGELSVTLNNLTDETLVVGEGERLGQGILVPFLNREPVELDSSMPWPYHTDRGTRGQVRVENDWMHTHYASHQRAHDSLVRTWKRITTDEPPKPDSSHVSSGSSSVSASDSLYPSLAAELPRNDAVVSAAGDESRIVENGLGQENH